MCTFYLTKVFCHDNILDVKRRDKKMIENTFEPIYNNNTKILILGSFPSIKSRNKSFYYMNPMNRFWKVLSIIYGVDFVNIEIKEKINLLYQFNIGLFDVVKSCEINGSNDQTISNVIVNDISKIINTSNISKIYLNGNTAYKLFKKHFKELIGIAEVLPSTSPANAIYSLDRLVCEWRKIKV